MEYSYKKSEIIPINSPKKMILKMTHKNAALIHLILILLALHHLMILWQNLRIVI